MKIIFMFLASTLFYSCSMLIPAFTNVADEEIDSEAVMIRIDKSALVYETDVDVTLKMIAKAKK